MTGKMLGFISQEKEMPSKRQAEDRKQDFNEIYAEFVPDAAADQANRCSQCGIPFCSVHCPLNNNIPDWLRATANGRMEEAYELASATNTFPEICGRICPQDRLCEGNCVIEKGFGSVTIGTVEKYITETAFENGWVQAPKPAFERKESVGIIGAGPGGLAAAEKLRRKGYQVEVYDRYDRIGGLLTYGIPGFKLEKEIIERRKKLFEEAGIQFTLNCDIGKDITFQQIRDKHDSVLIATGVYKYRAIKAPGVGLAGVEEALDYLTASNKKSFGDTVEDFENGRFNAEGKNVVVIGGGDTAMDCVRTAIRQGAKSVKCLYRRDQENMPGSRRETNNAMEEGVEFVWLSAPEAFLGDDKVTGVKVVEMRLGAPDASGRRSPEPVEGSQYDMDADLVIKALGFDPEDHQAMFNEPQLDVTDWGTLKVDMRSQMTNLDGVFGAGDIVRGASLVVWAIRDGRDAADQIHKYIRANASADMAAAE